MGNQRLLIATAMVMTSVAAFLVALLLLQSTALATGVAAGLVGLFVIFIDPFIGLVNYLIFLYIRPQDYMQGLVGIPVMFVLGTLTLVLMILHMAVRERSVVLTRVPQNFLTLWFLVAIPLSHLAWLSLRTAAHVTFEFAPTVVMYFLVANLVGTRRKLKFTVNLVVVATLVLAAQGLVQHFTGKGLGGQEAFEGRIQSVGIFSDPNDLALALVVVMPYVFLKLTEPCKLWEKPLAAISMAVLLYALYLTQSRGGLLAFGALMALLATRRLGRAFGLLAGVMIFLAVFVVAPRMATISTGEASAYGRIQAWGIGLDLFEQHPLFGVGARNFTEYHFRTAHNSFVLCAAELGFFGLYAWVMMIYVCIRNNEFVASHLRAARMHDIATYVNTVRYGLVAFVAGAFFLSRTYNELLYVLVGLSAAITHIFVSNTGERFALIERRDFIHGLFWTAAGWLVTKLFLYIAW